MAITRRLDDDSADVLRRSVEVLAAKWSVPVLAQLSTGTLRFGELLGRIDGVSRRMLAATLRQLERDGLVSREVYARVPARVDYQLSDAGEELLGALAPLLGWGVQHLDDVTAARRRFDESDAWRTRQHEVRARSQARIV